MDQKPKIEVEELLKLKKHEKPEPEFWEKFDQGLRRKSMEALVKEDASFWQRIWERKGFQQVAVATAFAFCAVPTYMGVQSFYAESQATDTTFQMAQAVVEKQQMSEDNHKRVAESTRELAMKKQKADNMRFVVDSYAVDRSEYKFDGDVWAVGEDAWKNSNRTYVNDRVKLLPEDSGVMPVNLIY